MEHRDAKIRRVTRRAEFFLDRKLPEKTLCLQLLPTQENSVLFSVELCGSLRLSVQSGGHSAAAAAGACRARSSAARILGDTVASSSFSSGFRASTSRNACT